jgi:phage terminase small subunit
MKQLSERQRTFCRLVHENIAPYRAYPMAGYRPHIGNPYRLLRENERVKDYIRQLEVKAMKKHEITVDTLIAQLEEARQNAKAAKQPASEISAVMGVAKLCGLLVEKQQIEQKDVSKMDMEEVLAALKEMMASATEQDKVYWYLHMRSLGVEEEFINRVWSEVWPGTAMPKKTPQKSHNHAYRGNGSTKRPV